MSGRSMNSDATGFSNLFSMTGPSISILVTLSDMFILHTSQWCCALTFDSCETSRDHLMLCSVSQRPSAMALLRQWWRPLCRMGRNSAAITRTLDQPLATGCRLLHRSLPAVGCRNMVLHMTHNLSDVVWRCLWDAAFSTIISD